MTDVAIREPSSLRNKLLSVWENRWTTRLMPFVILLLIAFAFSLATGGRFLASRNLTIILNQALVVATVATGGTFIFATGNVNLAMGATTVLCETVSAMAFLAILDAGGSVELGLVVMFVISVTLAVFIMGFSAILSTKLNVRVLYVTIVMMTLLAAIQQALLGGSTLTIPSKITRMLANNNVHYIIFGVFFAFAVVIFHFTKIGRTLRFIGTNEICAHQTGKFKKDYLLLAFVIGGLGMGLGAMVAIIRSGSVSITTLSSLNMDTMLAIVLGGMSVFGGSKSFVYAGVIGAVTVTALQNGMVMVGVDSNLIQGVRGLLFLLLVAAAQKRPHGLPAPEG
ncbi:MAG TPA: ABC transporter permease [Clostridia bacterium]|jgi:ribose transport system permease protein|nr:ABC transporter permease [Clostridia bacterium]HQA97825.1 ABC transporter permease [Clostridia bacterium]HQO56166.1 ABC transporter permease [Clostridia bacterium]